MVSPILVTGVGQRLGLALAKDLLAKGQPIIGTYRTQRESIVELEQLGATLYQCDFYQQDEVTALINGVLSANTSLRAVVHNASEWLPDGASESAENLHKMMTIHASVPFQINTSLAPLLKAGACPYSDIIHISDYVASKGSKKHIGYAASKAAMENLSLSFANALAPLIKVNAVAPALLLFNTQDTAAYRTKALDKSLIPREGGIQEFLNAIDFLLNSNYITGQVIHLDGGRHLK